MVYIFCSGVVMSADQSVSVDALRLMRVNRGRYCGRIYGSVYSAEYAVNMRFCYWRNSRSLRASCAESLFLDR